MRIVVHGAGAIGASVGGWLTESGNRVTFLARPECAELLGESGLWLYPPRQRESARALRVHAVSDLAQVTDAEVVVLAVKNYDLEPAAREIRAQLPREPLVVALQNGVDNQAILPKYFSRVVYGVVCFNAWRDAANVFGYERRGPILFGVLDERLRAERDELVRVFGRAFTCSAEDRITDAARCKMALNLANSITTLVGLGVRPIEDVASLKQSFLHVVHEGIQILQRAGVSEVRLQQGASWRMFGLMTKMPGFVSTAVFKKKISTLQMTSMAQDVYLRGNKATELESLNGHFLKLAESVGFDACYNRALYRITREWLAQPEIRPMHEAELWARLQSGCRRS
jgi:2-dehydropantoate 2-reductase